MENQLPQSTVPTIWETNPKLKTLLLVLIFVFLFSGIGLTAFSVWSNSYRQKVYEETKAGLPVHVVRELNNQDNGELDARLWKTYRNNEYGFEFRYSSKWSNPVLTGNTLELGCPKVDSEGGLVCPLTIRVEKLTSKTDYIKNLQLTTFEDKGSLINKNGPEYKVVNTNNAEAVVYRDAGMCTYTQAEIFGKKQNYLLSDNCEVYQKDNAFNEILNSFKEIEILDTSTWKTYKNNEYGFEFKYPSDLFEFKDENFDFVIQNTPLKLELGGAGPENKIKGKDFMDQGYQYYMGVFKYYDSNLDYLQEENPDISRTELNIPGIKAIKYDLLNQVSRGPFVFISKPNSSEPLLQIGYGSLCFEKKICDDEYVDNVFNTILSTFKFTPMHSDTGQAK